jgi:hypothetical protein
MSPEVNLPLLLGAVALFQAALAFWAWRSSGSMPGALLVALIPVVGLPYQLWQLRARLFDNHVAGAITYLGIYVAGPAFYFTLPADETPWMLLNTMALFALIGVANVVGTSLKD